MKRILLAAWLAIALGGVAVAQSGQYPNNTVAGNVSGSPAPATPITAAQLTTLCNVFTSSLPGCVSASGGGTTNFLRADGTWTAPAGGGGGGSTVNLAARFGSMDVWQRGAGTAASIAIPASSIGYTVDGCYLNVGNNTASTVASTAGIATGSFRAAAITKNSGQAASGSNTQFGCPLDTDEIALFRGQFVALSFTASTGAGWDPVSGNIVYTLYCGLGTPIKQVIGFSAQTTPVNTSVSIAAGAAAARYQTTSAAIVPSNCTQAEIQWTWLHAGTSGANDSITIDDVQLEIVASSGSTASAFVPADFNIQLVRAQRHYVKTFPYGTAPAQNAGVAGAFGGVAQTAGGTVGIKWMFQRQMRVSPTITTFDPSAAAATCRQFGTSAGARTVSVDPDTAKSADDVLITCATSATAGDRVYVHAVADAGI